MKKNLLSALFALATIYASAQTGNVGINTATPQTVLDVNGNARVQQLPAAAGNITYGGAKTTFTPVNTVVADANGVFGIVAGTPASSGSAFWSLTGNAGTTAGTNFLGTTDAQPLMFKVNNVQSGYASALNGSFGGNVALGVNSMPYANAIEKSASLPGGGFRQNIAIGERAMANVNPSVELIQNVAVGDRTLMSLSSGGTNIAIGDKAMMNAKGAASSIAIGVNALMSLNTSNAWGNIAMGYRVAENMTSGRGNIFLKDFTAISGQGDNFISGDYNIFFGQDAGFGVVNGNNNLAIGASAKLSDGSNQLNIGNSIYGTGVYTANPKISIGNSLTAPNSTLQVGGSVSAQIRTVASGTIADNDFTVLAQGNISLPAADNTNTGRIYHIVNDTNVNITLSGNFRINGVSSSSYGLNNTVGGRVLTVQSTGSAWVVLSNY